MYGSKGYKLISELDLYSDILPFNVGCMIIWYDDLNKH